MKYIRYSLILILLSLMRVGAEEADVAATRTPELRPRIYSDLHKQILTNFGEAGVEIMSPHYRQNRTGNVTTIPPQQEATDES